MGLWKLIKRIFNVLLGKTTRAVQEFESRDPEAVFNAAIEAASTELVEIKLVTREAQGLVFAKNEVLAGLKEYLSEREDVLKLAVTHKNEEVGLRVMADIETTKAKIASEEEELKVLQNEAAMAISALEDATKERNALEDKRKIARQMEKTERIMSRIEDRKAGMANDTVSKALENATSRINTIRAARGARTAIEVKSLDGEVTAMQEAEKTAARREEFASLMAASKKKVK